MEQVLIYLHLQKTGGLTFRRLLHKLYRPEECFDFGVQRIIGKRYAELNALSLDERLALRCVMGMLYYGIHESFPQKAQYIAFMRQPVERTISHYYYILRNTKHRYHKLLSESGMSMDQFLEEFPYTAYYQTRVFLPVNDVATSKEESRLPLPPNALATAKANISTHFPLLGLTERYDESLLLLQKHFGWKSVQYTQRNIGTNKPKSETMDKQLLSRIEQHVATDMELYEWAKARFETQVAEAGDEFEEKLRVFQAAKTPKAKPFAALRKIIRRGLKSIRRG